MPYSVKWEIPGSNVRESEDHRQGCLGLQRSLVSVSEPTPPGKDGPLGNVSQPNMNPLHCRQELLRVLGSAPGQGYPFLPAGPGQKDSPDPELSQDQRKHKDQVMPEQQDI